MASHRTARSLAFLFPTIGVSPMAKSQKGKTIVAVAVNGVYEMPADASPSFIAGTALAVSVKGNDDAIVASFAALDSPEARKDFRAGFVARWMFERQCDKKSADSRFDYLAKLHAPAKSSRKRKANAGKKRGRKEKTESGAAIQVSAKDALTILHAATVHAAKAQETFAGDARFLAWLGEHVAVLNGTKKPE
jgi:hypothetical protein